MCSKCPSGAREKPANWNAACLTHSPMNEPTQCLDDQPGQYLQVTDSFAGDINHLEGSPQQGLNGDCPSPKGYLCWWLYHPCLFWRCCFAAGCATDVTRSLEPGLLCLTPWQPALKSQSSHTLDGQFVGRCFVAFTRLHLPNRVFVHPQGNQLHFGIPTPPKQKGWKRRQQRSCLVCDNHHFINLILVGTRYKWLMSPTTSHHEGEPHGCPRRSYPFQWNEVREAWNQNGRLFFFKASVRRPKWLRCSLGFQLKNTPPPPPRKSTRTNETEGD